MSSSNNSDLPPEILCEIFSYLSTDDRLNVRLTCRHFYDLCNERQAQQNEELVFHGDLNTGPALQLLSSSPRRIPNIRFNHVHIEDTVLPYFIKHGRNIHSLSLQNCKFQPGLFKSMMEQCTALRSFHLKVPLIDGPYQYVFCDIRALSENLITFEQVVDVRLHVGRDWEEEINPQWSNQIFLRCLALFPRVKKLDLKFDVDKSFNQLSTIPSDIASDIHFTASCIYVRILALKNQLEELQLHLYSSHWEYSHSTIPLVERITEIEMRNLKVLSLNLKDNIDSLTPNPFLTFKNLTHIHCDLYSEQNTSPSIGIQLILNTIPGLVSLVYLFSNLIDECDPLSKPCFEALIRSRLTRLKLGSRVRADFGELSLKDTFEPNYLLKRFSIDTLSNEVILLFASYFRFLEHITFLSVDETTLHTIFKIQNNLRSLSLYNKKSKRLLGNNYNFTSYNDYNQFLQNDNLSQNRFLPHLTHLRINEDEIGLTKFLLTEFRFPLLKSLTICLHCRRIDFEHFLKILTQIPQVQFIKLYFSRILVPFEELRSMVRTLPNLCHVIILDTDCRNPVDTSEYLSLFNVRSSLRTVTYRHTKYFHDTTTGVVRELPLEYTFSNGFCEGIPHRYEYDNKCSEYREYYICHGRCTNLVNVQHSPINLVKVQKIN